MRSLEEVGVSTQSPLRCRQQLPRYAKMCQDDSRTPTNYHKLIMAKARVRPFWEETIAPALKSGKTVFVAAHGNSIRAILKFLEGISDNDITGLETSDVSAELERNLGMRVAASMASMQCKIL